MSEQHEDIEAPRHEPLGSILERTRRGQHKTLEDAAEATRISPRVLAALEADDFARLPAEVFTRGFIKLYAEYLGLDPEESLEHYINQENADPDKPAARPYRREVLTGEAMAHAPNFFKGKRRTLVIIVLLAVLIGLYLLGRIYKPNDHRTGEKIGVNGVPRSLVEKQSPPVPEVIPPAAGPVAEPETSLAAPGPVPPSQLKANPDSAPDVPLEPKPTAPVKPQPSAALPPAPAATTQAGKVSEPEPSRSTAAAYGDPPVEAASHRPQAFVPVTVKVATTAVDGAGDLSTSAAATSGPHNYVLEARFRESSWVHVEVDDEPAREYTSQADVTRVWRAARHLVLELGNGGAVDLTLNGKPMPVAVKPGEAAIIRIPPTSL